MTELYQLTIHEAGELLRQHKISSVELTRAHLDRIRDVDDKVKAFICTQDLKDKDYITSHNLVMVTKKGQVKKTCLEKYSKRRVNGVAAITIKEGDELLGAEFAQKGSLQVVALTCSKILNHHTMLQLWNGSMQQAR